MRERYEIENIEQLRAIADMLRIHILDLLNQRPMTVTQLGERLGLAPAKVHYHVRELERVGLVELVETREKGGILEKYYQPIAYEIGVNKALLSAPADEAEASLRDLLDQVSAAYLQEFRRLAAQKGSLANSGMSIGISHIYVTQEEQNKLMRQFYEMLKLFEKRRGIEGEKEITLSVFTSPTTAPAQPQKQVPASSQANQAWVVGAAEYTRGDLLKARAEGRRLRISVIGLCHFAADVEPSLADEVIESFTLVGKLTASPEVKAVLKQKEV